MSIRRMNRFRLGLAVTSAVLAAGPGPAKPPRSQAEWTEIGVATDGTRAFVDRRSTSATGERVALWQRFTLGPSNPHGRTARTVEQRVVYDCRTRIVSTLESRDLSGGGRVLRKQRFQPPVQDAIRGGTLPEYIFEAVCP